MVAYNRKDSEAMIRLVGQGPVEDPGLGLDETHFESVEGWLAAADRQGDTIRWVGYSPLPLQLYVERESSFLADLGIDVLSTTLRFEASGACSVSIEATDFISQPDPCAFSTAMGTDVPEGCTGPFDPRHSHVAVWTGSEVLVFGGDPATSEAGPSRTGLALDPATGEHRELPASPLALEWWPRSQAFWTGTEMGVVGRVAESDPIRIVVLLLDPATGDWRISEPRPGNQWALGAAVWTGEELLLVGGDTNDPRNSSSSYDPDTDTWRELEVPPFHEVEGIEGVWTGEEAFFVGGYPSGAAAAYDPATDTWREITPYPEGSIEGHSLVWTDAVIVVVGGNSVRHTPKLRMSTTRAPTSGDQAPDGQHSHGSAQRRCGLGPK